ncbi:hypothetical protein [Bacillus clarus]|uniref:Uncharacterized protein n=1 Tax=Bacillus clarus TaxID=2338372 RepID=A0A090YKV6_9BACI|nr:hypothetical protein [Bacillus clarus]KFM98861.1 hypothetical protein DJ93_5242 [Bacillus clarus]
MSVIVDGKALYTKRLYMRKSNVENVDHTGRLLSYFEFCRPSNGNRHLTCFFDNEK